MMKSKKVKYDILINIILIMTLIITVKTSLPIFEDMGKYFEAILNLQYHSVSAESVIQSICITLTVILEMSISFSIIAFVNKHKNKHNNQVESK